jgi:hypothetical protein
MTMKKIMAIICLVVAAGLAKGALALTGTSYTQNFDSIGSGLPIGWSVDTGATSSSTGSAATLTTTAAAWGGSTGQFANFASSDGLTSTATSTTQAASTDRALGIRQTGSLGDPGAAFEFNIANTTGLDDFSLSISLQMLSVQTRSTTWTIDYRVGDSGGFTTLGTYSDPAVFGSTIFTADSTALSSWNNQSQDIWFRVVALNAATGSGNRDTFGIDDFSLSYSAIPEPAPVPEPAGWSLISAIGLLGICGGGIWRGQRAASRA